LGDLWAAYFKQTRLAWTTYYNLSKLHSSFFTSNANVTKTIPWAGEEASAGRTLPTPVLECNGFEFLQSISCTGGPRYMRSFYLQFCVYAIQKWPFSGTYPLIISHPWSFYMQIHYMRVYFWSLYPSHITRSNCIWKIYIDLIWFECLLWLNICTNTQSIIQIFKKSLIALRYWLRW